MILSWRFADYNVTYYVFIHVCNNDNCSIFYLHSFFLCRISQVCYFITIWIIYKQHTIFKVIVYITFLKDETYQFQNKKEVKLNLTNKKYDVQKYIKILTFLYLYNFIRTYMRKYPVQLKTLCVQYHIVYTKFDPLCPDKNLYYMEYMVPIQIKRNDRRDKGLKW